MIKLSARWVYRLLTVNQKHNRMTALGHYLVIRNPKELLRRFLNVNETCLHHCKPERKVKTVDFGR